MKQTIYCLIGTFILISCSINTKAQPTTFYEKFFVTITDLNYEPIVQTAASGDGVTVSFSNTTVHGFAAQYNFRQFQRAYPNTLNSNLQDIFLVEVSDIQFMYDLIGFNEGVFNHAEVAIFGRYYLTINDPNYVPTYSYNNYVSSISFTQSPLNDIAADYNFTAFQQAFPNSTESSQQDIYLVEVSSSLFGVDLQNHNGGVFTLWEEYTPKKFYLYITDPNCVPMFSMNMNYQTIVSSNNSGVQGILNNYTIYDCTQMYPNSYFLDQRQLYFFEANSMQLMDDLIAYNNTKFPSGTETLEFDPYLTPNDFTASVSTGFPTAQRHHKYLDLINARDAWEVTTGNMDEQIGISDWYVFTKHQELIEYDWQNPNNGSKIREQGTNSPNYVSAGEENHGTAITGTVAGITNNNLGLSSIGYNLRVGIRPHDEPPKLGFQNLQKFAEDEYRIVNISWGSTGLGGCKMSTIDLNSNNFYGLMAGGEELFDELYQRGTLPICAAGNGTTFLSTDPIVCNHSSYTFPSSYDHSISVTSVGSDVTYNNAQSNFPNRSYSVNDVHDRYLPINTPTGQIYPVYTHHNNQRVDICAPGYSVHVLDYDPSNRSNTTLFKPDQAGTSLAAPLVTGTVGLMASSNQCLTPFQLEYLLKTTADASIYNITENQKYDNPKQLGTGRLDAEAAVLAASQFDCNNPPVEATTLFIEEIKIDTRCWQSQQSKLTPVVRNKNPNATYTYRWKALTDNNALLDDEYIESPTISTASGQNLYFLLTVTETGVDVPRVAKKRIRTTVVTSGADLALRDAYGDNYDEPNNMDVIDSREWDFWNSPDVINNMNPDPLALNFSNPEYATSAQNYMHIRVKNVGCATSAANQTEVRAYWTIAATGEKWPSDWTTSKWPSGTTHPGGLEITNTSPNTSKIYVPACSVGQEQIIVIPWYPPNPANYGGTNQHPTELCLLVRLLESQNSPYGLDEQTEPTTGHFKYNLRQNNNIATRNMYLVNFDPFNRVHWVTTAFGNATSQQQTSTFEMLNYRDIRRFLGGNLSAYMYAVVHLGDLYDIWVDGGSAGNATVLDENAKTLLYDPATPLRLENLVLDANQKMPIDIEFKLRDNITVPTAIENATIHIRQTQTVTVGEETYEETLGGMSYAINIDTMTDTSSQNKIGRGVVQHQVKEDVIQSSNNYLKVYPNPGKDFVRFDYNYPISHTGNTTLIITNVTGQIVKMTQQKGTKGMFGWITHDNPPGVYTYKLLDGDRFIDVGKVVLAK